MNVSITISLPLNMVYKLNKAAGEEEISRSKILAKAVEMYFENKMGEKVEEL